MRKLFLSLAIFATSLVGAANAEAAMGIIPSMSTYASQVKDAPAVVKARLVDLVETQLHTINGDGLLHRNNVEDVTKRRDLKLEITEVIRSADGVEITTGEFTVVSPEQRRIDQLPASMASGSEVILFLTPRTASELWEIRGNTRGILSQEDGGDFQAVEGLVKDLAGYKAQAASDAGYFAQAQDRMMNEVVKFDTRLAVDALIDFGWNFNSYNAHFNASESATLLSLLEDTSAGTAMRNELITALGRTKPAGGQEALVDLLRTATDASTISLGAWALEQYGRGSSSEMLLDAYSEAAAPANQAALIRAVGLIRPKSYRASEANARSRFVDVLRATVKSDTDGDVLKESLIAARDMRFSNDELHLNMIQILQEFRSGVTSDEVVYKRAIVAMAATRTEQAKEYLLSLKGEFSGLYDKHIDLAIMMPMHTLVD
ncbi:MAG: hypothetical protein KDB07_02500, partial [Planctomycetes bacterium]|nr:hypothetical protein [Planctomycetota bacterium]